MLIFDTACITLLSFTGYFLLREITPQHSRVETGVMAGIYGLGAYALLRVVIWGLVALFVWASSYTYEILSVVGTVSGTLAVLILFRVIWKYAGLLREKLMIRLELRQRERE